MSDLLTDARETLADISSRRPGQTHYEGCRTEHVGCLLADLVSEVERLREAIRRIAEQDATLSVCDGNVTVQMDATLTDEPLAYCCRLLADSQNIVEAKNAEIDRLRLTDAERQAVEECYEWAMTADHRSLAATLRGLGERLK